MRSIRQPLHIVLGLFLFAAALMVAGPAAAHDVAESSSPAQGATVPTPPEKVSITFNNNPLALGSQITVTDATGADWSDGGVEIVDNVVSQKLRDGAPAGEFTVVWRVVSSDSHPIEGSFTFTASSEAGSTPAAGAVPTLATAEPGTTAAPEIAGDSSEPFPWSLVIFAVVGVGILIALAVLTRRRLGPGETEAGEDERERSSKP